MLPNSAKRAPVLNWPRSDTVSVALMLSSVKRSTAHKALSPLTAAVLWFSRTLELSTLAPLATVMAPVATPSYLPATRLVERK